MIPEDDDDRPLVLEGAESLRDAFRCLYDDGTLWIRVEQMARIFGRTNQGIERHLEAIYAEGDFTPAETVANTRLKGSRKRRWSRIIAFRS